MHPILVAGAGKIGRLIACLLAESGSYKVFLSDIEFKGFNLDNLGNQQKNIELVELDATNKSAMAEWLRSSGVKSVVSSLPFFCNIPLAECARELHLNYFDLTEDTKVTDKVRILSEGAPTAFVPQCGIAPGFISIVANELASHFDEVHDVLLRVGAIPAYPHNALNYALNWSTEGVINEYGNPCYGIMNGQVTQLQPLEALETIDIEGQRYEAFNTSGGLGSLAETFKGKVQTMNYKTMRYPGHCEKMRLLMNDLKLNQDRETLKRILENALPKTLKDVVIVYVAVSGIKEGELAEEFYVKKVQPQTFAGRVWSAIQVTTASSVCSVIDLVTEVPSACKGLVLQESFSLEAIIQNRFGKVYA